MATIIPSSFPESIVLTIIREIEKSNDELERDRERIADAEQDARKAEADYAKWQPTPRESKQVKFMVTHHTPPERFDGAS